MYTLSGLSLCLDLDGTIIDTAPDLVRVLNLVIAEEGLGEVDYEIARGQVSNGAKALIRSACARAGHKIEEDRVDELWHLFLKLIFAAAGHRQVDKIVMVGDSSADIMAARAAGVPSVLMRYGYAGTPTTRLRADITLRQFRELPGALLSLIRPSDPY